MRIVRYRPRDGTNTQIGIRTAETVHAVAPDDPAEMDRLLGASERERRAVEERATKNGAGAPLKSVVLLSPLSRPPHIFALAGNYTVGGRSAIAADATPWIFPKSTYDVGGPDDDIVLWNLGVDVVEEIELAIVIGRAGRDVSREDALRHVGGYTVCNDVSARKLALRPDRRPHKFDAFFDWLTGKLFDGYAILGPEIVTADELGDGRGLELRTRVNGEIRVQGNTNSMVFGVDEVVAFVSTVAGLVPGDVIMTGMPHTGRPETFLKPGDVIEGEIERIGLLRNGAVKAAERKGGPVPQLIR